MNAIKRVSLLLAILIVATAVHTPAFAGDTPDSLLFNDDGLLFFGRILSYDANHRVATALPEINVKGDISIGAKRICSNTYIELGDIPPADELCLIATFTDNRETYVFTVTSADTRKLKITNIRSESMWKTLEQDLNQGRFEAHESMRRESKAKIQQTIVKTSFAYILPIRNATQSLLYTLPISLLFLVQA